MSKVLKNIGYSEVQTAGQSPKIPEKRGKRVDAFAASERALLRPEDRVEIGTPDWTREAQALIRETVEELGKRYPGVQIITGSKADAAEVAGLRQTAAALGSGSHLILSAEFLDRMSSSEEDFYKCRDVMEEMLAQLSGKQEGMAGAGVWLGRDRAVTWVIPQRPGRPGSSGEAGGSGESGAPNELASKLEQEKELLRRFMENAKKKKEKSPGLAGFSVPANSKIRVRVSPSNYNAAASYQKLAKAGSKPAVQEVMSEARRSIMSLRLASCFGNEKERIKAAKAIRSFQKLLLRGRQKTGRLQKEEIIRLRKRKAEERQEEERARRIQAELEKKRTERRTADGALMVEGRLGQSALDWYKRTHPNAEDPLERIAGGTGCIPPEAPSGAPAGDGGPAGPPVSGGISGPGGVAPAEVVVTDSFSF